MKKNMEIEARYEEWRKQNPLRLWREGQEPQVSRATVCAATGVTTNSVVKWEQGTMLPSDENMATLANLMGHDSAEELKAIWQAWMQEAVATLEN